MKVWNWEGFWSYFVNPISWKAPSSRSASPSRRSCSAWCWPSSWSCSGCRTGASCPASRASTSGCSAARRSSSSSSSSTPACRSSGFVRSQRAPIGAARPRPQRGGLSLGDPAGRHPVGRDAASGTPPWRSASSRWKAFVLVIMPQAMRVIVPALGNSVNGLLKTTSIASVISMEELLRRGQILMQQRFEVLEVFVCIAIIYLVMTTGWEADPAPDRGALRQGLRRPQVAEAKQLARDDR